MVHLLDKAQCSSNEYLQSLLNKTENATLKLSVKCFEFSIDLIVHTCTCNSERFTVVINWLDSNMFEV